MDGMERILSQYLDHERKALSDPRYLAFCNALRTFR